MASKYDELQPYWQGYSAALDDIETYFSDNNEVMQVVDKMRSVFELPVGESINGGS